jgi:hypothetical protein
VIVKKGKMESGKKEQVFKKGSEHDREELSQFRQRRDLIQSKFGIKSSSRKRRRDSKNINRLLYCFSTLETLCDEMLSRRVYKSELLRWRVHWNISPADSKRFCCLTETAAAKMRHNAFSIENIAMLTVAVAGKGHLICFLRRLTY